MGISKLTAYCCVFQNYTKANEKMSTLTKEWD